MANRIMTGKWGEDIAVKLLEARGYVVLQRNYRTRYGEMDIVTQFGEILIFVEVKTRTNRNFGFPEDAITATKRAHLEATAQAYLQDHPDFNGEWRIDVIAIEQKPGSELPEIEWFENAI